MSKNSLDDVHELMDLSEDELNEVLLDEKYNKANLREIVRRSLLVANEYKREWLYEKDMREDVE